MAARQSASRRAPKEVPLGDSRPTPRAQHHLVARRRTRRAGANPPVRRGHARRSRALFSKSTAVNGGIISKEVLLGGTEFIPVILRGSSRPTDCRRTSLRPVPQHRQKIQADQMRDALFLMGRLLTPELAAEYAGCRQFRREFAPGQQSFPGEWHLPEQVTGFFDSACDFFHVAPRVCNRLRPDCAPCLRRAAHIYSDQNRHR